MFSLKQTKFLNWCELAMFLRDRETGLVKFGFGDLQMTTMQPFSYERFVFQCSLKFTLIAVN